MEVDGHRDLRMVLSRNECPLSLEAPASKHFDSIFDDLNNDLKDDPNVQADQLVYRGDIPLVHDLEDSEYSFFHYVIYNGSCLYLFRRGFIVLTSTSLAVGIINALNDLIKVVNLEVERCKETTRALDDLRRLITECELCRQRPAPTIVPTCETHPPGCHPSVRCHNTPQGPTCGSCPRGYTGDGECVVSVCLSVSNG